MTGLGALAQLDLRHLHCVMGGPISEMAWIKLALSVSAAKIARPYFPDDVTAMFEMIGRQAAFSSVVIESTDLCAKVERLDSIAAECAEAHCRNIEARRLIRPTALIRADMDPCFPRGVAGQAVPKLAVMTPDVGPPHLQCCGATPFNSVRSMLRSRRCSRHG